MSRYIAFVESPFQILCLYEAMGYFKPTSIDIYVRYSDRLKNDSQMLNIIEILNIKEQTSFIKIASQNKTLADLLKIAFYKLFFLVKLKKYDKIIIGNYDSRFIRKITSSINKCNFILIDDGSKTIETQSKFNKNFYIDFFTLFDIEKISNQYIYINKFKEIRRQLVDKNYNNDIIFLGSKLSEIGIITEEYYIKLIKQASNYFNSGNIIYIPHREEKERKINDILMGISNILLKKIDYPVELYGFYEKTIPKTIASFFSTALYTMPKIYNCQAIAFSFDYSQSKYKERIDMVYKTYKNKMDIFYL